MAFRVSIIGGTGQVGTAVVCALAAEPSCAVDAVAVMPAPVVRPQRDGIISFDFRVAVASRQRSSRLAVAKPSSLRPGSIS